ncbi:MAG TPA: DegT/DnrJ/EryC1/StrS family aminotransferase [Thermoleophilaceae bacterium]|nr:DegT/DnrJ/EryC1/StrS family aminotransferase [Thermoleophilaceae bacterium]
MRIPGPTAAGESASSPLRFQRPSLPSGDAIERYLSLAREERWFSNGGPCWKLLRDRLSERVGAYCVPVASGTVGLMAAVAAVAGDAPPHSKALLPSFTFAATVQAAIWTGLDPLLLDVDSAGWHMDCAQLEEELHAAGATAALALVVSSFGTPPPPATRQRWEQACRAAGVPLVIDSAAGFGAIAADGVPIGAQGDVEVVSFHATKPFAIGEGGAVFSHDARLIERIERTVNFGLDRDRSVVDPRGLNGKMSELHAATALAVLDELDSILAARRGAAAEVRERAGADVSWQAESERSAWQFVPVAFADARARGEAQERCAARIETRVYYEPLHHMPAYRELPHASGGLSVTERLAQRLLCLPMANDLTSSEAVRIATAIRGRAAQPAG